MNRTRDALSPELLDMLWHRVVELGETRKEAMEAIQNKLHSKLSDNEKRED